MSNVFAKRGTPVKANQHVITAWGRWHTAWGGGVVLRGCGGMLRGGQSQTPAGAKLVVPGLARVEGNDAIEEAEGMVRGRGVVERKRRPVRASPRSRHPRQGSCEFSF